MSDVDEAVKNIAACTDPDVLDTFRYSLESVIQYALVENKFISEKCLWTLCRTGWQVILEKLVYHPGCTPNMRRVLSRCHYTSVQAHVASHPSTPHGALCAMYKSGLTNDVLYSLAANYYCPLHIIKDLSRHNVLEIRLRIAGRHDTPRQILAEMTTDIAYAVRNAAASNPRCPKSALISYRLCD